MITNSKIESIQKRIKDVIREIESEENVKISLSKMNVMSTAKDVTTSVEVNKINTRLSNRYGFSENIIGKTFTNKLGNYTITEFSTINRKYPIVATCSNGKTYKMSPSQVKMYFK